MNIKVQKTTGQMGLAVGAAASLCKKYDTTPRGVYQRHLAELQDIVFERGEHANDLQPADAQQAKKSQLITTREPQRPDRSLGVGRLLPQLQIHTSREREVNRMPRTVKGSRLTVVVAATMVGAFVGMTVGADESPGMHGWRNDGSGRFDSVTAGPTEWGPEQNIRWKTPLPHRSNASPIFVEGRLYVCAEPDELLCVAADTGAFCGGRQPPILICPRVSNWNRPPGLCWNRRARLN